jgi:hypothetical protein
MCTVYQLAVAVPFALIAQTHAAFNMDEFMAEAWWADEEPWPEFTPDVLDMLNRGVQMATKDLVVEASTDDGARATGATGARTTSGVDRSTRMCDQANDGESWQADVGAQATDEAVGASGGRHKATGGGSWQADGGAQANEEVFGTSGGRAQAKDEVAWTTDGGDQGKIHVGWETDWWGQAVDGDVAWGLGGEAQATDEVAWTTDGGAHRNDDLAWATVGGAQATTEVTPPWREKGDEGKREGGGGDGSDASASHGDGMSSGRNKEPVRSGINGGRDRTGSSGGSSRDYYKGLYHAKAQGGKAMAAFKAKHGDPPGKGGSAYHRRRS